MKCSIIIFLVCVYLGSSLGKKCTNDYDCKITDDHGSDLEEVCLDGYCRGQVTLGEPCIESRQCKNKHTMVCMSSVCHCAIGFKILNGTCEEKSLCNVDADCDSNEVCDRNLYGKTCLSKESKQIVETFDKILLGMMIGLPLLSAALFGLLMYCCLCKKPGVHVPEKARSKSVKVNQPMSNPERGSYLNGFNNYVSYGN
jgi:hypothetical protein